MKKHYILLLLYICFTLHAIAQKPELITQIGHRSVIQRSAITTDGKIGLSSDADGVLILWDLRLGKVLRRLEAHKWIVNAIAFSADQQKVASAGFDGKVIVWEINSGKILHLFQQKGGLNFGEGDEFKQVAFSKDGHYLAALGDSKNKSQKSSLYIFDLKSNRLMDSLSISQAQTIAFGREDILWIGSDCFEKYSITQKKVLWQSKKRGLGFAISADEKLALSLEKKSEKIQVIDLQKDTMTSVLNTNISPYIFHKVQFTNDHQKLIIAQQNHIRFFDLQSGKQIRELPDFGELIYDFKLLPNEEEIFIQGIYQVGIISAKDGKVLSHFKTQGAIITNFSISPKNDYFALGLDGAHTILLDAKGGKVLRNLYNLYPEEATWRMAFTADNQYLYTASTNGYVHFWELETGRLLHTYPQLPNGVVGLALSPNNQWLFVSDDKGHNKLYNTITRQEVADLSGDDFEQEAGYKKWMVFQAEFLADNRRILLSGYDWNNEKTPVAAYLFDIQSKKILQQWLANEGEEYLPFVLLPNGDGFMTHIKDTLRFYDFASPQKTKKIPAFKNRAYAFSLSADGNQLLIGGEHNDFEMYDLKTEKLLRTFRGHTGNINTLAFIPNTQRAVSGGRDKLLKIWDIQTGKEIASLVALADTNKNYAIITPEGRFEGTNEGLQNLLHFSVGREIINLEQLKDRYFEPNIWRKLMAYSTEPLRQVPNLDKIDLYPELKINLDTKTMWLEVILKERNGGVGKVPLYINGKEADEDITRLQKNTSNTFKISLLNHTLIQSGANNTIEVRAYNRDNWLVSRPERITFKAPLQGRGAENSIVDKNKPDDYDEPQQFFALCVGVSEYKNPQINLKLSAKDAEDMANAFQIASKRMFEIEQRGVTHIYKLTSKQADPKRLPTRKNILAAFAEIIQKARHQDVIVVYLAGHGVNYGGQEGDFYFLTADALSMKLDDPAIRAEGTISSREITEFFKKMKAQKQVLIMDACHSGRAIDNLMNKRDLEGTTIRALDKMKDRTGLHIISGCTADAVSYEASQFEQGLLTYSLLSGIQGKALKDNQLIDVSILFQHAREEVPELARGIGGIQEPKIFSPYGGESFYLGLLTEAEKAKILLASPKPTFLPCKFADQNKMIDVLKLENLINEKLQETAARGNAPYIFVNMNEIPQAYKIAGLYEIKSNQVLFKGALYQLGKDDAISTFNVEGEKDDLEGLCDVILKEVRKVLKN